MGCAFTRVAGEKGQAGPGAFHGRRSRSRLAAGGAGGTYVPEVCEGFTIKTHNRDRVKYI